MSGVYRQPSSAPYQQRRRPSPLGTPPVVTTYYAQGDLSGFLTFDLASTEYIENDKLTANGTGDFEIVCYIKPTDWTRVADQVLLARWGPTASNRSIQFKILTNGALQVVIEDTTVGVITHTTGALGLTDNQGIWLRCRFDADDGGGNNLIDLDQSSDPASTDPGSVSWSTLANPASDPNSVTLVTPSATKPWFIGARDSSGGDTDHFDGDIHYLDFWRDGWRGAGGTQVFEADFRYGPTAFPIPDKLADMDWNSAATPAITGTQPTAESDTAQPVAQVSKTIQVGQAIENDSAFKAVTPFPVNQATETDTAQPVTGAKSATVNQTVETDSAQAVAQVTKTATAAQALETDTAQAVVQVSKVAGPLGQAVETDTAQAIAAAIKSAVVGQAVETDSAFADSATVKTATAGQAVETDTAGTATTGGLPPAGQAIETDSAFAVAAVIKVDLASQASETDSGLAVSLVTKDATVGQASETDTALAVAVVSKVAPVGQALETDTAGAATSPGISVAQALETDTAFTVNAVSKIFDGTGQAVETDSAFTVVALKTTITGQSLESDTAFSVVEVQKKVTGGIGTETSSAFPVTVVGGQVSGVTGAVPAYAVTRGRGVPGSSLRTGRSRATTTAVATRVTSDGTQGGATPD